MTVVNSEISWCTGTLNLTVGCTAVSAGCENCYAETLVGRGIFKSRDFSTLQFYPERIGDLRKFAPGPGPDGQIAPKLVFVNSLSDFWHEQIGDDFIHAALDRFEEHPRVILQILTKRPVRMRRLIAERYKGRGVPPHLWLGVSAEDNRVAARINFLRRLKDQVGDFTAFVSIEPIVGPTDELDFTGVDWVLTGGESGPRARPMRFQWLEQANEAALALGIALHFKQYGQPVNNPVVRHLMDRYRLGVKAAWAKAVAEGLELAPQEKGGATYRGRVIQQKPPHFWQLKADLNPTPNLLRKDPGRLNP
ncbi:MAG TPA: DUF5131 family protein [Stellaceae bacterium]|nr:DUF5131 family protein [Stellaceae bacterium]